MSDPLQSQWSDTRKALRGVRQTHIHEVLEIARMQQQAENLGRKPQRAQESAFYLGDMWASFWSDRIDRLRYDPYMFSVTSYYDRRYGRFVPVFQTEMELNILRMASRILAGTNNYAMAFLANLTRYVVGTGFTYEPMTKRDPSTRTSLDPSDYFADAVKDIWEDFQERNSWYGDDRPGLEEEFFQRWPVDGEAWLMLFCDPDTGLTTIREIEPEQVTQPPGGDYQTSAFGVLNSKDDTQDPEAAWVFFSDHASDGQWYPFVSTKPDHFSIEDNPYARLLHFRRNTPRTVKRGCPDFVFDTYDTFLASAKLRRNLGQGAAVQAGYAIVREHEAVDAVDVSNFADAMADFQRTNPLNGQLERFRRTESATYDVPQGMKYVPPPSAQNGSAHIEILNSALLVSAGAKWGSPPWMIGSKQETGGMTSGQNMGVAESPWIRAVESAQGALKHAFLKIFWQVIRFYCEVKGGIKGRNFDEVKQIVECHCEPKSVVQRDKDKQAQTDLALIQAKIKSPQQVRAELGIDSDEADEQIKEWEEEHGPIDQPPGGNLGGPGPNGKPPGGNGKPPGQGPQKPPPQQKQQEDAQEGFDLDAHEADEGGLCLEADGWVQEQYNPSEPRDQVGKWTTGGGGSSVGAQMKAAFATLDKGSTSAHLYGQMYDALRKGSSRVAGIKDPALAKAKPFFDKGLIKSPADLYALVQAGYDPAQAGLAGGKTATAATPPQVARRPHPANPKLQDAKDFVESMQAWSGSKVNHPTKGTPAANLWKTARDNGMRPERFARLLKILHAHGVIEMATERRGGKLYATHIKPGKDHGVDLASLVGKKVHESFDEAKHPRGQPENAGQFGSGGNTDQETRRTARKQTRQDFRQTIKSGFAGAKFKSDGDYIEVRDGQRELRLELDPSKRSVHIDFVMAGSGLSYHPHGQTGKALQTGTVEFAHKLTGFVKQLGQAGLGVSYETEEPRRAALYAALLKRAGFEQVKGREGGKGFARWQPAALQPAHESIDDLADVSELLAVCESFDPSQPRDDTGRWRAVGESVRRTMGSHVEATTVGARFDALYDTLKKEHPDLTPAEFRAHMRDLHDEGLNRGGEFLLGLSGRLGQHEPRQELIVPMGDDERYYVKPTANFRSGHHEAKAIPHDGGGEQKRSETPTADDLMELPPDELKARLKVAGQPTHGTHAMRAHILADHLAKQAKESFDEAKHPRGEHGRFALAMLLDKVATLRQQLADHEDAEPAGYESEDPPEEPEVEADPEEPGEPVEPGEPPHPTDYEDPDEFDADLKAWNTEQDQHAEDREAYEQELAGHGERVQSVRDRNTAAAQAHKEAMRQYERQDSQREKAHQKAIDRWDAQRDKLIDRLEAAEQSLRDAGGEVPVEEGVQEANTPKGEAGWRTINGTHVYTDAYGNVTKGPGALKTPVTSKFRESPFAKLRRKKTPVTSTFTKTPFSKLKRTEKAPETQVRTGVGPGYPKRPGDVVQHEGGKVGQIPERESPFARMGKEEPKEEPTKEKPVPKTMDLLTDTKAGPVHTKYDVTQIPSGFNFERQGGGSTYHVKVEGGKVTGCSCPDSQHRSGANCKHCRAAKNILAESTGAATPAKPPHQMTAAEFQAAGGGTKEEHEQHVHRAMSEGHALPAAVEAEYAHLRKAAAGPAMRHTIGRQRKAKDMQPSIEKMPTAASSRREMVDEPWKHKQGDYVNAVSTLAEPGREQEAREHLAKVHEWNVKRALNSGKHVPEEVLAQYPKLKAKYRPARMPEAASESAPDLLAEMRQVAAMEGFDPTVPAWVKLLEKYIQE